MDTHPLVETSTRRHDVIVYFDGVCGFCNASVNFLLDHDRRGALRFAPLQGETARERLPAADVQELNTLVATVNRISYRRSAAVVRILWSLGPGWSSLGTALWLVPLPIRDLCYRVIARYRYWLFGKRDACRLPKPEEQARFLP